MEEPSNQLTTTEQTHGLQGRVPVPPDPTIPCTLEQLLSIFGADPTHRLDAERELLRKLRESRGTPDEQSA